MSSSPHLRTLLGSVIVAAVTLVAACGDSGPTPGPGTVTATVVSPNGSEGAAVLTLFGPGLGDVTAVEGRAWSLRQGDSMRVVLVRDDGGDLAFTLALADTTRKPGATLLQVAGPDDQLRAALSGYRVDFR